MLAHTMDEASTLTQGQKRELRVVVEAIKNEWAKKDYGHGTETL